MSITSDLKSYTDKAVSSAQSQLNDVTGQANEFYGKARSNVSEIADKAADAAGDLRTSAEKAINLDAIKSAVEPYVTKVIGYATEAQSQAEKLLAEAKKRDKRVASVIEAVEQAYGEVDARVVKPVLARTGLTSTAGNPRPRAAAKPAASRPATTRPATRATAKPAAKKSAARKSTAKKTTGA